LTSARTHRSCRSFELGATRTAGAGRPQDVQIERTWNSDFTARGRDHIHQALFYNSTRSSWPYGLQGCSMPTHSCWLARPRWSSLVHRSPGPRDEHAHVRTLRWVLGGPRCHLVQFDRVRQNSSARSPMKWRRFHMPRRCWTASGEIMIPIGTVGVATRHMPTAGNGTRARHCGWQPWSRESSRPGWWKSEVYLACLSRLKGLARDPSTLAGFRHPHRSACPQAAAASSVIVKP
jgi:hypothetical protein